MLRNELRRSRYQGHRAASRLAQQGTLLALLAPFSAWRQQSQEARHAARLRGELESVNFGTVAALSSARADVKASRHLARRSAEVSAHRRSLLCLAPVIGAWSRQAQASLAARRLRPGEVLLDSGQATKRAQQQLQEARAQHSERLAVLEKEIAELRKEASANLGQELLLQVSNAQMAAAAAARREARVENIARRHELAAKRGEELSALLACIKAWQGEVLLSRSTVALRKEAQERLATSLERVHLESRGQLHQAWSEAAEKSRLAAALERQLSAAREGSDLAPDLAPLPYDGSRPSTALQIEERLRRNEALALSPRDEPSRRFGGAEVLTLEPSREDVRAAREGRKGLFIAALKQQAKYWQANAFHGWYRVLLQDRYDRIKAMLEVRKKASAPPTPRTKRS